MSPESTRTLRDLSTGEVLAGRFRILRQLGSGGMGQVYEAIDNELGRPVALKMIRPELTGDPRTLARFKHEIRLGRDATHPSLCRIYDFGTHREERGGRSEEVAFLTMELLEGETLSSRLRRGRMTAEEALPIVQQTAAALSALHDAGIIHRDLKPGNIMLARNRSGALRTVVTDFGLARTFSVDVAKPASAVTEIAGTPAYMAPEQLMGLPATPATDVFALGVVMFEMLTGQQPFEAASSVDEMLRRIHKQPPNIRSVVPDLPRHWDQAIAKCLCPKPEDRYQRAEEIIPSISSPAPLSTVPRLAASKRTMLFAAAVITILLAIAAIYTLPVLGHTPNGVALAHYKRGVASLEDGAYFAAMRELGKATDEDPKFVMAHARRAESALNLDLIDDAEGELLRTAPKGILEPYLLPKVDRLRLRAIDALVRREYPDAIAWYRDLTSAVSDEDRPAAYVSLGQAYQRNLEIPQAIDAYKRAEQLNRDYAPAVLKLGELYTRQGATDEANRYLDRAAGLFQSSSNQEGHCEALIAKGQLLSRATDQGELQRAREVLDQALKLAQASNDLYQQLTIMMAQSSLAYGQGNFIQGEELAKRAVELARESDNQVLVTRGLVAIANALSFSGKSNEDAARYFREVLQVGRSHSVPKEQADAARGLSQILLEKGEYDPALQYIRQATDFYNKAGYRREATQMTIVAGRAQRNHNDLDAALNTFETSLALAREHHLADETATAEESIAGTLGLEERYPEALKHLDNSMAILGSTPDPRSRIYDLLSRADTLWKIGRSDESAALFTQISADPLLKGSPELTAWTTLMTAEMELSRGNLAQSQRLVQSAMTSGEASSSPGFNVRAAIVECLSANPRSAAACEAAMKTAMAVGNSSLIMRSKLAIAEADLANRKYAEARVKALEVARSIPVGKKLVSTLVAWSIASEASRRLNDNQAASEYAASARKALEAIDAQWGTAAQNFRQRADIRPRLNALN